MPQRLPGRGGHEGSTAAFRLACNHIFQEIELRKARQEAMSAAKPDQVVTTDTSEILTDQPVVAEAQVEKVR